MPADQVDMERNDEIVTKVSATRDTSRAIVGVTVQGSAALIRRILGSISLRSLDLGDVRIKAPKTLPWPNFYLLSFLLFVVIPAFLCIVYLVFIASDQYVAEARFAVRTAQLDMRQTNAGGAVSSLGSGSIPSLGTQDAYIITNYIRSRAIIEDLSKSLDIKAIFRRPEADFWARLSRDASAEELTNYWKTMVTTYVDGPSGIVIVTARAFRPADAQALVAAVLDASEKLANEVSERARRTIMRQAEDEVRRSEGLVRAALAGMQAFRDNQGFIDPLSAAKSTGELLMQDMSEKIRLENDYFVTSKATSPDAPTVVGLKTRIEGLDTQIAQLKSELTGTNAAGRTIAASLVTFEELELKRIFAEKLYTMAQDALERARMKAEQQNIFISTFVQPAMPEDAKYPERFGLSLLIPLGLLICWGIFALISAAIEDHRY
jgi:capsular polysaccharide transport system permease protein